MHNQKLMQNDMGWMGCLLSRNERNQQFYLVQGEECEASTWWRRQPYLDLEKGSSTTHKHEHYENYGSIREQLSSKHRR